MSDYPKMLYGKGGEQELHGLPCATLVVEDAAAEATARREGWSRTPHEAHGKTPVLTRDEAVSPEELAAAADEKAGLLQEIEALKGEVAAVRGEMASANEARALAEKERDETRELLAAFDRDGDGKPGGSKAKAEAKAPEKA